MGGRPPLGYDVVQRRLVVNEREAAMVRKIFEDFARVQSVTEVVTRLAAEGVTTKAWTSQEGKHHPGHAFEKKGLYALLRNRMYLGELHHQGQWYPGQHDAILDRALWDRVQAILAVDPQQRAAATQARGRSDALLRGLLFDASGTKMHHTFTKKKGREYRYYISNAEMRFGAAAKTCARIPAEAVETATVAQIKTVLSSPEAIAAVCRELQGLEIGEDVAVLTLARLGETWDHLFPVEQHRLVNLMIERIDLVEGGLKITWRELGWKELLGEFGANSIDAEQVEWEATA